MLSILAELAAPAIQSASEYSPSGQLCVRAGPLITVIGYWVYQQGGLLGYALKNRPELLEKLTLQQLTQGKTQITGQHFSALKDHVAKYLDGDNFAEKTFVSLFTMQELKNAGVNFDSLPLDKKFNEKVYDPDVSNVMRIMYLNGVALGYNFPDIFFEYWGNTYKHRDPEEFRKAFEIGLVLSDTQRYRPLVEAISELIEYILNWCTSDAPDLLTEDETQFLQGLV
jgi:hypothetical protein